MKTTKRLSLATATLLLALSAIAQTVPTIIVQPVSQATAPGATVSLSVSASGAAKMAYQWQKNTTNMVNGAFSGRATVSGVTTAALTLTGTTTNDQANYACRITNTYGNITSSIATLTVYVAPTITTQPLGKTNSAGANVTFTVVATGSAPLNYQWRKDGTNIPSATLNAYSLNNVSANDTGNYTVSISNPAGTANSSTARLVVQTPPTVAAQPVGGTVFQGDSFTFKVTASGDELTYQWKRNGTSIPAPRTPATRSPMFSMPPPALMPL